VIRSVVVFDVLPGAATADVAALLDRLAGIDSPGLLAVSAGADAGVRADGWSHAIVVDAVDERAYDAYDGHPTHQAVRTALLPLVGAIARCQLRVAAE
jgi:hypothetical protein